MPKYFVGKMLGDNRYLCRLTKYYNPKSYEVLWEGDNYLEGMAQAKDANTANRPPKPIPVARERHKTKAEIKAEISKQKQLEAEDKVAKWFKWALK